MGKNEERVLYIVNGREVLYLLIKYSLLSMYKVKWFIYFKKYNFVISK